MNLASPPPLALLPARRPVPLQLLTIAAILVTLTLATGLRAAEPPVVPVGLDAYRQWDKWPYQRIGVRAYLRSTYDRHGNNRRADAANFLHQRADDFNVTLDVEGRGVLYFARYNHWHGSPWHYVIDGTDHVVTETSSADPDNPVPNSRFEPTELFPAPLTFTWSTTKGADLMWVPLTFERSFQMAYERTFYGTGYYIYHLIAPGTKTSRPLRAWDGATPPEADVLELLARAGTDISPPGLPEESATVAELAAGATVTLLELTSAPAQLRRLAFSVPRDQAVAFGRARLRITWDNRSEPSVDAPVALFFGAGSLYNGNDREFLVKAFPVNIRYGRERVELACYFPMPFFRSARIELVGTADESVRDIAWTVKHEPFAGTPAEAGWFHATYRDHGTPAKGQDLVLLDTRETEGGGDWSGNFIGTSFIFSDRAELSTLEGDPRFFFDDSQTPQAQGTGTEEWGGGGDYWGGQNMTLPFAGHPTGVRVASDAEHPGDLIESAYRFLLADLMPFGRNARIQLEHGGVNNSVEHYRTVTYWYGAPFATLVKTDTLRVGDEASERAHAYHSPDASAPYQLSSRYEWGPDHESEQSDWVVRDPVDRAEFEFEAKAGVPYHMWFRGRSEQPQVLPGSFWVQFDDAIGSNRPGFLVPFTREFNSGVGHWRESHFRWSSRSPDDEAPLAITFATDGMHRLRVFPRTSGGRLDQILLSPTRLTAPDGPMITPGPGEVLLNPRDAVEIRGDLERLAEADSATGEVLGFARAPVTEEFFPPHTDTGRVTTGTSEFTLQLRPDNLGVMLRRKLDYAYPNQRAEVFVADSSADPTTAGWQPAGIWYLAGANTWVHSYPSTETGATQHIPLTSNRRFRDDEFLIARTLTEGRSEIRVRVVFTPVDRPLFPGHPLAGQAWSEIRYDAYCYVLPGDRGG